MRDPFRLFLVVGFLVLLPIAFYHRIRSATRERLNRREEGLFILLTLRPIGLAVMAGFVAYLINPESIAWGSVNLPRWLRWTGVVLWTLAALLVLWTMRTLGPNLTDTVVTRQAHTMVTSGPYRWVRHPFYSSVALLLVSSALVAANWALLVGGGLVFVLLAIRTRTEEAHLIARFGPEYRELMSRTGRFFPRFGRAHRSRGAE